VFVLACSSSPVDYRWNLVPDGNGQVHLIDSNPIESEPEPFFNAETQTRFLLFTRSNPTAAQVLTWTAGSISGSNFNAAHPVRVLIHGFNSGPGSGVNLAPTARYLQRGNFNVIV
jgi:pancreatic triacylglycerol lipase